MNNTKSSINVGGGGSGLLQAALIVLKLTGHISISWWLVFLPTLIPLAILFIIGIVALVIYALAD